MLAAAVFCGNRLALELIVSDSRKQRLEMPFIRQKGDGKQQLAGTMERRLNSAFGYSYCS